MKFYHVSNRELREGTILTVGVYGERIRRHDFIEEQYKTYIKEEIFETIREQYYPGLPSRFDCVFLFAELEGAKASYANKEGYGAYVYEVEIEEGKSLTVEMDLLNCDGLSFEKITTSAHKYWKEKKHPNSGTLEILLNGRAKVKKMVLEPSNVWDL